MSVYRKQTSPSGGPEHHTGSNDRRYEGRREGQTITVTVNGKPLNPRFDLANHSPNGFEWGYGGSGPAQLALALLADCLGNDNQALGIYQEFKFKVVAQLPHESWSLTSDEIQNTVTELTTPVPAERSNHPAESRMERGAHL